MSTEEILDKIVNFTYDEWNNWKKQQDSKKEGSLPNLSFPISHQFSDKNFQYFDFSRVQLLNCKIWNCDFSKTILIEADLQYAEIGENSKFVGADLKQASLILAKVSKTDFTGAYLGQTDCSGIELNDVLLIKSSLKGANLWHSKLTDVDLSETDLTESILKDATFTRVDFSRCIINPQNIKINDESKFIEIKCDFVYFYDENNKYQKVRYPPYGHFVAGEFEKFIKGEIDMNNPQKNRQLLDGSTDNFRPELNIVNTEAERNRLREEVDFLKKRLNSIELQEKLDNHKKVIPWLDVILPILIVSIVFMGFSWILINKIDQEKIEVSVNYDVGVIMGGLLTGSAALIAALSYAKWNNKSNQNNRE